MSDSDRLAAVIQHLIETESRIVALADALRRGRSTDNPALQEELTTIASESRNARSRLERLTAG